MHQYNFKGRILYAIILSFFSVIAWQLIGCSQKKVEQKKGTAATAKIDEIKNTSANNTEEKDYLTDTIIGSLYVRIHNRITTNGKISPSDPVVWDGPVEIGKKPGLFSCKIDTLWIIEHLEPGPLLNQLLVKSYNGSNNRIDLINVDSCKIINTKVY